MGAIGGVVGYLTGAQNLNLRNTDITTYLTLEVGTGNRNIRVGGAIGFTDSFGHNVVLSKISSHLYVVSQAEASTGIVKGGFASCVPAQMTMDQVKSKLTIRENPGGTIGGMFALGGCSTGINGTGVGSVSITDSYSTGSYTGTTTNNLSFGGTIVPQSGTDVVVLQRLYSSMKFTPTSTMALGYQSPNFTVDITNNPTVSSSSVLYRAESFPYGINSNSASAIAELDSELKNQTPGNVFETSNFDFSSGGKWKWCATGEYPRLKFEDCSAAQ